MLTAILLLVFSQAGIGVGDAQDGRPSRARCRAKVREGLARLTLEPLATVDAVITDWGGSETAAAL